MKTIEKVKSEREHDETDKRRQGEGRYRHQPVVPVPRSTGSLTPVRERCSGSRSRCRRNSRPLFRGDRRSPCRLRNPSGLTWRAPAKLKNAAQNTAVRGRRTRVETTVAIEFAAS